jgi:hypothetical protein
VSKISSSMLLHPYRQKHDVWLAARSQNDSATAHGIEIATNRAATALRAGNLLSSHEAMLMAGPEVRARETLFSIARATAFADGGDEDAILVALERRFKALR